MATSLKRFISVSSMTFKAFDHNVIMSSSRKILWHFTSQSERTNKKYAVFCVPNLTQAGSLISAALNQASNDNLRLVVVSINVNEIDIEISHERNYCVVSLKELQKFGEDMLRARARES